MSLGVRRKEKGMSRYVSDWVYGGRVVERGMAFRLAMVSWRVASQTMDWGSEEAVWAVEHLSNEISKHVECSKKEIVKWLQEYKWKRVAFVDSMNEYDWLVDTFSDYYERKHMKEDMYKKEPRLWRSWL